MGRLEEKRFWGWFFCLLHSFLLLFGDSLQGGGEGDSGQYSIKTV